MWETLGSGKTGGEEIVEEICLLSWLVCLDDGDLQCFGFSLWYCDQKSRGVWMFSAS